MLVKNIDTYSFFYTILPANDKPETNKVINSRCFW